MNLIKNERGSVDTVSNIPFLLYIFIGIIALFIFYEAIFIGYRYFFVTSYMNQLSEIYTVSNYAGTNLRELDSKLDTTGGDSDLFGKIDRAEHVADRFELLMENLSIPPTDWYFEIKEVNDKYDRGGEGVKFLVLNVGLKSFFMPKMFVDNPSSYNAEFVESYYTNEMDGKVKLKFVRVFSHKTEFDD